MPLSASVRRSDERISGGFGPQDGL
jgi:hypothetical protein